jgi:hypothetical protein
MRPDLYRDFSKVFGPLVDSGVMVIGYLGNTTDPDMRIRKRTTWLNRVIASLKPLLDAKCDIGLDASSGYSADSPEWTLAELLKSLGVNVWVEARPTIAGVHQHKFDWISCEGTYQWQKNEPWAARDTRLTGRCLRWLDAPPAGQGWGGPWMREGVERVLSESPRNIAGVAYEWLRPN